MVLLIPAAILFIPSVVNDIIHLAKAAEGAAAGAAEGAAAAGAAEGAAAAGAAAAEGAGAAAAEGAAAASNIVAETAKLIEPTHIFILAGVVAVGFFICARMVAQLDKALAEADALLAEEAAEQAAELAAELAAEQAAKAAELALAAAAAQLTPVSGGNQTILQMICAFFSNILTLLTSFSWSNPKLVADTNEIEAQVSFPAP